MALDIRIDDQFRLVSSVLLLTKFVDENMAGRKPHKLRIQTLKHLGRVENLQCVMAIRQLTEEHWINSFLTYASYLGMAPNFMVQLDLVPGGCSNNLLSFFEEHRCSTLLAEFYEKAELGSFWAQTEDSWDIVISDCSESLEEARVDEFMNLLFGFSINNLVLVPNPLCPPSFGFEISNAKVSFALWGPPVVFRFSPLPLRFKRYRSQRYLVFHEMAHSYWSKVLHAHPSFIDRMAPLEAEMKFRGWFPDMYPDWKSRFTEILIEASTALYRDEFEGKGHAQRGLSKLKSQHGVHLVDPVFHSLKNYLAARKRGAYNSLIEYLPILADELLKKDIS